MALENYTVEVVTTTTRRMEVSAASVEQAEDLATKLADGHIDILPVVSRDVCIKSVSSIPETASD